MAHMMKITCLFNDLVLRKFYMNSSDKSTHFGPDIKPELQGQWKKMHQETQLPTCKNTSDLNQWKQNLSLLGDFDPKVSVNWDPKYESVIRASTWYSVDSHYTPIRMIG